MLTYDDYNWFLILTDMDRHLQYGYYIRIKADCGLLIIIEDLII